MRLGLITLVALGAAAASNPPLCQEPDPAAVKEILRRLHDLDPNVRRRAADAARKQDIQVAGPRLIELLADPEYTVAIAASFALEELEIRGDASILLRRIRDGAVDFSAARSLLEAWSGPDQVALILENLKNEKCTWRKGAIGLLLKLKSHEAVPLAMKWLDDPEHPLREDAAYYLAALGVREAAPNLRKWALTKEPHECQVPIRCLRELGIEDAGDVILAILKEGPAIHRFVANCGFGVGREYDDFYHVSRRTPVAAMVPTLEEWLAHAEPRLRSEGAMLLGWLEHAASAPKLKRLLSDSDVNVRVEAVKALASMKSKEHLPAILERASEPEDRVRSAVATALGSLRGPQALGALRILARDREMGVRRSALEAIAEAAPDSCGPDLIRGLEDPSRYVSLWSIPLIQSRRIREAAPLVAIRVDSDDDHIRERALKALLSLRATDQAEEIARRMAALKNHELHAAAAVACSLGSRRGGEILFMEAEKGDDVSLGVLNALRAPASWDKIVSVRVGRELVSISDLLKEGATLAGIEFKSPPAPDHRLRRWLSERHNWGWTSLDEILCFWDSGPQILIDADGIRVVPRAEAIAFWRKWLSENCRR